MGRIRDFLSLKNQRELLPAVNRPVVRGTFSEDSPVSIDDYVLQLRSLEGLAPRVSREQALTIPVVLRGRNIVCGTISSFPLVTYRGDNEVVANEFLNQIDPFGLINQKTLSSTVEDLLFEEVAYWRIYSRYQNGYPAKAYRLNPRHVNVQEPADARPTMLSSGVHPEGTVYVDGVQVPNNTIIRFDSPNPGFLKTVGRIIMSAIQSSLTAEMYLKNPMPKGVFTPADNVDPMDNTDEVRELVKKFAEDRNESPYAYIGAALKFEAFDNLSPSDLQLVEIDKAVTLGVINAMGLDPADMGYANFSMTYNNAVDKRKDRVNNLLNPYMVAVEQTLSSVQVTPRGYFVRFDKGDYFQPDPKTRMEVYTGYKTAGVMTADEIRAREGLPPLTAQQKAELTPSVPRPPLHVKATVGEPLREIEQ